MYTTSSIQTGMRAGIDFAGVVQTGSNGTIYFRHSEGHTTGDGHDASITVEMDSVDIDTSSHGNGVININAKRTTMNGAVTAPSFNATSDYRVKENVQTISGGIYTIDNLRPVSYVLKGSQEPHVGFIAHELQEHIPTAVRGEKDGETMQSVNYSELIPILVKEIQDLKQEVHSLKQQVQDLSP